MSATATVKDSTTLAYNDNETLLTMSVNDKPLHKYVFIPSGKSKVCCNICDFNNTKCDDIIRCLPSERKDEQNGYYQIVS